MNLKDKYSPKQALAYFLITNEKTNLKNIDNLIDTLKEILLKIDKIKILEMINTENLMEIENYWSLKKSQVVAYGILVFNHFRISSEDINNKYIINNFIFQMKIYSPDNAVDFVNSQYNANVNILDE